MQFHYWINPQGKEIKVREHVPYILDHPEEFGYDPDEIKELSQNDEWVEPILDEVIFEKGWIRVYGFHGEITISSKNRNKNKDRIYQFLSDHADELYRIRDIEFYFGGNRVINVSMHIRDFLANPDPLFEEKNNSKFATLVESLLLEFDVKKTVDMLGPDKLLARLRDDRTFITMARGYAGFPDTEVGPQLIRDLNDMLVAADPTPTKSYSRWILQTYISGGIKRWEDLVGRVRVALEGYDGLKKRRLFTPENNKTFTGPNTPNYNDIFNIKRLGVLEDLVEHFLTEFGENSSREEEAELERQAKAGSEIIDYPQCKVIHPTTERAACWWGRGSRWCTATKNPADSMFDNYNNSGDLYILIPKNPKRKGEKYQIHVPDDEKITRHGIDSQSLSFMNEKDDYADLQKFLKDPVYAKPLQDLLGVEENDEFVNFWGDLSGEFGGVRGIDFGEVLKTAAKFSKDGGLSNAFPDLISAKATKWLGFPNHAEILMSVLTSECGRRISKLSGADWATIQKEFRIGTRMGHREGGIATWNGSTFFVMERESPLLDHFLTGSKNDFEGGREGDDFDYLMYHGGGIIGFNKFSILRVSYSLGPFLQYLPIAGRLGEVIKKKFAQVNLGLLEEISGLSRDTQLEIADYIEMGMPRSIVNLVDPVFLEDFEWWKRRGSSEDDDV